MVERLEYNGNSNKFWVFCDEINCRKIREHTVKKGYSRNKELYTFENRDAYYCIYDENKQKEHSISIREKYIANTQNVELQYNIIECKSCKKISLREIIWFKDRILEEEIDENGEICESETYECEVNIYPYRNEDDLILKEFDAELLDSELIEIIKETVNAFNGNLIILASIGQRALLERICILKGFPNGINEKESKKGLSFKISKLTSELSRMNDKVNFNKIKPVLDLLHREIGNEAAHGLQQPSKNELRYTIESLLHLIDFIFNSAIIEFQEKSYLAYLERAKRRKI